MLGSEYKCANVSVLYTSEQFWTNNPSNYSITENSFFHLTGNIKSAK